MPSKLIVSISDLHLGRGNNQDSFCGPKRKKEIEALAHSLGQAKTDHDTDVTLVLNGDIFDMWELVTDEELEDGEAALAAIRRGLLVPVTDDDELEAIKDQAGARLEEALDAHDEFVQMLKTVVDGGGTVHYNAGNHDHRFSHPRLRVVLQEALNRRDIALPLDQFDVYFRDEQLGFYAEHGDQFSEADSRSPYATEGDYIDEAKGFYFLRYVWNRAQQAGCSQPTSDLVGVFQGLEQILDGTRSLKALGFLIDYFRDVKRKRVPGVESGVVQRLYCDWASEARGPAAKATAKARPRATSQSRYMVPNAVPSWLPGIPPQVSGENDSELLDGLSGRFVRAAPPFPQLDSKADRIISLGHTHNLCANALRTLQGTPLQYLNSGSWTGKPMGYVWVYKENVHDDRSPVCGIQSLAGGIFG